MQKQKSLIQIELQFFSNSYVAMLETCGSNWTLHHQAVEKAEELINALPTWLQDSVSEGFKLLFYLLRLLKLNTV